MSWYRQQRTLEMIASENFVPQAVLECQGSVLTNKYAEGYPGRRYYGGCENVDVIESLAIERVKALFGAGFANVQSHSGAQANAAAMQALIKPGDTILGLSLAHGGHLTHGMRINFSGLLYDVAAYEVSKEDYRIDMDEVGRLAREYQPKLIIAGWSAYPRRLDFERFREIADEVGALLMVDMAHFAGLVAAGCIPTRCRTPTSSPPPSTRRSAARAAGSSCASEEYAKKINSAVFPGQQGGPLEHVIAAKAVALKIAAGDLFSERQERTLAGARRSPSELPAPATPSGCSLAAPTCTWCSSTCATRSSTASRPRTACTTSGSPSTATRCRSTRARRWSPPACVSVRPRWPRAASSDDFVEVGRLIAAALGPDFDAHKAELRQGAAAIAERYPLNVDGRAAARQPEQHRQADKDAAASSTTAASRGPAHAVGTRGRDSGLRGRGGDARTRRGVARPAFAAGARSTSKARTGSSRSVSRCRRCSRRCRRTRPTAPRSSCARASPSWCEINEYALFAASRGNWPRKRGR